MWAAQFYRFNEPRRYISSLGLGAMGYGYPAAIGAKVACPDKQVIDIDGDGSFMMNIQELATCHIEKIAAKAMILNNQHLGMVVQWEDRFYGSVRGNTILGDETNVGSPDNPSGLYPDFVKIAEGFGVKGRRVIKKSELQGGHPGDARSRRSLRPRHHRALHRTRAADDSRRQDREGDAAQVNGSTHSTLNART
jgi:acetolactate synthase-1/2/3 large subunit